MVLYFGLIFSVAPFGIFSADALDYCVYVLIDVAKSVLIDCGRCLKIFT